MKMLDSTDQASSDASPTLPLLLTVVIVVGLVALLVFIARMEKDGPIGFLVPYKDYLSIGFVCAAGAFCRTDRNQVRVRRRSKGACHRMSPELYG